MKAISKKVCLLGDFAVGKTSLVRRFVLNIFEDRYLSTIGVKVSRKTVVTPGPGDLIELTLMLWDLAGSEEFDQVRASYLRGASGAVLVCDLTRPETQWDFAEPWINYGQLLTDTRLHNSVWVQIKLSFWTVLLQLLIGLGHGSLPAIRDPREY